MSTERILVGLAAAGHEVTRRKAGADPDSRFDLALDVLADLADVLSDAGVDVLNELARTLVAEDDAPDY